MKGQTLIETLLAIAIIGIIVSGISVLVVTSLNNSTYSRSQAQATQYTQQGLELVRKIRNQDYATFAARNNTWCLQEGAAALGGTCATCAPVAPVGGCTTPNIGTAFIRSVKIDTTTAGRCDVGISKVTVAVSWNDGRCSSATDYCHKSELSSCLSTTSPITAP